MQLQFCGKSPVIETSRRRAGLAIAFAAMGAAVATIHVLPGFNNSYVEAGIRNSLHVLGFAAVAAVASELLGGSLSRRATAAISSALLLGVVAELVQLRSGLSFNPGDLGRDVLGALVYLVVRFAWARSDEPRTGAAARLTLRGLAVLVVGAIVLPLVYWLWTFCGHLQRMPDIFDAGKDADLRMLNSLNSRVLPRDTGEPFSVRISRTAWTGILVNFVVRDWSDYRVLVLRVAMADADATELMVDLSDGPHPGYRLPHRLGIVPVGPEATEIRLHLGNAREIPGRPDLDTGNVEKMWLRGRYEGDEATLRLYGIWLE
jgi:hypothetical protein